jgi:hypothetical protein
MNDFNIESISASTLNKMRIQIESTRVSDIEYVMSTSKTAAFVAEWVVGVFNRLTDG